MMTDCVGDMSEMVAPRVGAELREARERIGYTLEEASAGLRIRLQYLQALEDGRLHDLPGVTYASGYLRTYASALGLDAHEIVRKFKHEADEVQHKTELEFPSPVPSRAIPAGALALMGVVLAVGAYAGWYKLSGQGRLPAETVTPLPARLAPLAQQAIPPAAPPTAPAVVAAPVVPEQSSAMPPLPLYQPTQAAAMPLPPPPAPPPVAPPAAAAPAPAAPAESRVAVRAKGAQVWIQVRERGGPILVDRVLRPGDSMTLPNRANLLLTTGNALATEFLVDGETTPGLGTAKGVKRELLVEADLIKDGRFAAQNGGGTSGGTPGAAPAVTPAAIGAPVTGTSVSGAPASGNGSVTRTQ